MEIIVVKIIDIKLKELRKFLFTKDTWDVILSKQIAKYTIMNIQWLPNS